MLTLRNILEISDHREDKCSLLVFRNSRNEILAAIGCGRCDFGVAIVDMETGKVVILIDIEELTQDSSPWYINTLLDFEKFGCIFSEQECFPFLIYYNDDYRVDLRIAGQLQCNVNRSMICQGQDSIVAFVPDAYKDSDKIVFFDIDQKQVVRVLEVKQKITRLYSDQKVNKNIILCLLHGEEIKYGFQNLTKKNEVVTGICIVDSKNFKVVKRVTFEGGFERLCYDYNSKYSLVWAVGNNSNLLKLNYKDLSVVEIWDLREVQEEHSLLIEYFSPKFVFGDSIFTKNKESSATQLRIKKYCDNKTRIEDYDTQFGKENNMKFLPFAKCSIFEGGKDIYLINRDCDLFESSFDDDGTWKIYHLSNNYYVSNEIDKDEIERIQYLRTDLDYCDDFEIRTHFSAIKTQKLILSVL